MIDVRALPDNALRFIHDSAFNYTTIWMAEQEIKRKILLACKQEFFRRAKTGWQPIDKMIPEDIGCVETAVHPGTMFILKRFDR